MDIYFLHFENIAESLKWPQENWTLLLQSVLTGKTCDVYTQLSVRQSSSFETVKHILKSYELVSEQQFRNCRKNFDQTYIEFARIKEQLFDK